MASEAEGMGANGCLGQTGDAGAPQVLHRSHKKIPPNPSLSQQIFHDPSLPTKSTSCPQQKCRSEASKLETKPEVAKVRTCIRKSSPGDESIDSPAACHHRQSTAEICHNSDLVAPKSKFRPPSPISFKAPRFHELKHRHLRRPSADCEWPERLPAAAPAATQTAARATRPLASATPTPATTSAHSCLASLPAAPATTQVAPSTTSPSAQATSDPVNRSWADVVRNSAVVVAGLTEERCKSVCTKRNPISSQEGDANQLLQQIGDSGRSQAFKRWAKGRCYRCLAYDHQVRFCKSPFRCIRCHRPWHRERHCRFQSASLSPHIRAPENDHVPLSSTGHKQMQTTWCPCKSEINCPGHAAMHESPLSVEDAGEASLQGHFSSVPLPRSISDRVANSVVSTSVNTKEVASTLLESLRSELVHLFEGQLEIMLRPIREEMSTIKLWLARVATHFEYQKQNQDKEHLPMLNVGELFGSYSPVRLSTTSTLLDTLAAECTHIDLLGCDGASVHTENCFANQTPMEQPTMQKMQKSIQSIGQDESTIIVEDACDDEPTLDVRMGKEDPIHIEENPIVDVPAKVVDPLMNDFSSPNVTTSLRDENNFINSSGDDQIPEVMVEDSHVSSTLNDSPTETKVFSSTTTIIAKRPRRHLCDKLLLRRSRRSAQRNILKDLGLVRKNGDLDEDKLDVFADLLKEILPQELQLSLMSLKDQAFWEAIAEIFGPLC